jgi:hypothetical protein
MRGNPKTNLQLFVVASSGDSTSGTKAIPIIYARRMPNVIIN